MTSESGIISLPMSMAETMFSTCTTFQTWADAEDAEEALAFIHHHTYSGTTFPALVITEIRATSATPIAIDTVSYSGALGFDFYDAIAEADLDSYGDVADPRETLVKFGNSIGAIIDEFLGKCNSGGNLADVKLTISNGGRFLDPHDQNDSAAPRLIGIQYEAAWGIA